MSSLLFVFLVELFWRMVNITNVDSSELKLFFEKFWKPIFQKLLLILMLADNFFKVFNLCFVLVNFSLLILHSLVFSLYVSFEDLQALGFGRLLSTQVGNLMLIFRVFLKPSR